MKHLSLRNWTEIAPQLSWLRLGRGQKALLIVLPLLSVAVAIIAGVFLQPQFKARAKLLVPFGQEHMYRSIIGDRMSFEPWKFEVAINAEREILNRLSLKTEVVNEMGSEVILSADVDDAPIAKTASSLKERVKSLLRSLHLKRPRVTEFEKAVNYLKKELGISSIKDSNVIHLSFKHKQREIAIRVLDVFLKIYLEQRSRFYAHSDISTLDSVLRRQREAVDNAQRRLMDYKAQQEIPDKVALEILEEELRNSHKRLQTIRNKIEDVRLERTLADARWTNVRLLEPPSAPQTPESLAPLVRIALAWALGLLAAILLIIGFKHIAFLGSAARIDHSGSFPSSSRDQPRIS